jgi:hypothetical protein
MPDRTASQGAEANEGAFARSFSKLVKKRCEVQMLAECVFRARLLNRVRRTFLMFPLGHQTCLGWEKPDWDRGVVAFLCPALGLDPCKVSLPPLPGGFARIAPQDQALATVWRWAVALLRFIRQAEKKLVNREGRKPLRDEEVIGVPGYIVSRVARGKRRLLEAEAKRLDESPLGSAILRAAARPDAPLKTLRNDKEPEKVRVLTRFGAGHNYGRDAEEVLVDYVRQATGRWYFEDVATLLDIDDPALFEKRSRDYRKRRSYGPKLLDQIRPAP